MTFSPPESCSHTGRIQNVAWNVCVSVGDEEVLLPATMCLCWRFIDQSHTKPPLHLMTSSLAANKVTFIDLHGHFEFKKIELEENGFNRLKRACYSTIVGQSTNYCLGKEREMQ